MKTNVLMIIERKKDPLEGYSAPLVTLADDGKKEGPTFSNSLFGRKSHYTIIMWTLKTIPPCQFTEQNKTIRNPPVRSPVFLRFPFFPWFPFPAADPNENAAPEKVTCHGFVRHIHVTFFFLDLLILNNERSM